ncbi:uncharacterized protein LOC106523069 [Austrofundulus limnaeus]|uniref:Uncharacterized protein LOC106523069 n=1 Tax=Austrofundulus limnaeus TaxID=52670 RepID=A0A2I4BVP0_AUSLI|nr:PREDICTED: uncharacterized protein LOC106523069 [Austrofundulus limnaeus]
MISEKSTALQSLDDLFERPSYFGNPHEVQDMREFKDLLKKMLVVNPTERISPLDALKHNFITMKHLPIFSDDSYVKEAFKIMSQCQPIKVNKPECENTISSHPGPIMAPPVNTKPEADDSDVIDKPQEMISEKSTALQSLDDLFERPSYFGNPHEDQDMREFKDLLKKMLVVNPTERISPLDALKHNFITMKHLPIFSDDSYVKEAFKIMSQCQPIKVNKPECENTISSHPGPIMAPPVNTKPEADDSDVIDKPLSYNPDDAQKHSFIGMKHLSVNNSDLYANETTSQCQVISEDLPVECESSHSHTSHPGPIMAPPVKTNPEAEDSDVIDEPLSDNPDDAQKHSFIEVEHLSVNNSDLYANEAHKTTSQCQVVSEDLPVECESSHSHTSHPDPTVALPEKDFKHKKPFRNLRKFFARIFNIHHVLS